LQFRAAKVILLIICGCVTWSITLREKCREGIFKNRVLRRIFVLRRDKETGEEWRRLHNKELYALYSSQNSIRAIK
jgi:hypothetical protein